MSEKQRIFEADRKLDGLARRYMSRLEETPVRVDIATMVHQAAAGKPHFFAFSASVVMKRVYMVLAVLAVATAALGAVRVFSTTTGAPAPPSCTAPAPSCTPAP